MSKKTVDWVLLLSNTLVGVFGVVFGASYYYLSTISGQSSAISALVNNKCTNDQILVATFRSMLYYLEGETFENVATQITLTLVTLLLLVTLLSALFTKLALTKAYTNLPSFGEPRPSKSSSLRDPLLQRNIYELTEEDRKLING